MAICLQLLMLSVIQPDAITFFSWLSLNLGLIGLSKERYTVFGSLRSYLILLVVFILTAVLLYFGFYSFYVEPSSVYTYIAGVDLIVAGFLMKYLFDFFMVKKKEKRKKMGLLKELLKECVGNLELVESEKIRWPQVHFEMDSYKAANGKTALKGLPSPLRGQIATSYQVISEIEKRKFRAFDKTTDMMLKKLARALPEIIEELKRRVPDLTVQP